MAFRLPRLRNGTQIADSAGIVTQAFQRWWQSILKSIETQEQLQDSTIVALQTVQSELTAAQADIIAAQSELTTQFAAIQSVTLSNAISASWISPSSVLSASDAGTDATVTIAGFTRLYDDGASVDVTGGSLTGLTYSMEYAVYYDDMTRASTTPTFVATTLTGQARHNFAAGRHYVDTITTPASGDGDTSGGGYTPPGGGDPGDIETP